MVRESDKIISTQLSEKVIKPQKADLPSNNLSKGTLLKISIYLVIKSPFLKFQAGFIAIYVT